MRNRIKPRKLTSHDWWLRMQTMNRRLIYFFETVEDLKLHRASATFKDWWKEDSESNGMLTATTLKTIVVTKCPPKFRRRLKESDIGSRYTKQEDTERLIEYFTTQETLEREQIGSARVTPRGRGSPMRQQGGRQYLQQFNPYRSQTGYSQQRSAGSVDPRFVHRVMPYQQQQPAMHNVNYQQQFRGGASGFTPNRNPGGRFGGQRNAQGRFQPRSYPNQSYGRPTNGTARDSYYQEEHGASQ